MKIVMYGVGIASLAAAGGFAVWALILNSSEYPWDHTAALDAAIMVRWYAAFAALLSAPLWFAVGRAIELLEDIAFRLGSGR